MEYKKKNLRDLQRVGRDNPATKQAPSREADPYWPDLPCFIQMLHT